MADQFCFVSCTKCYAEFTDPKLKIDSSTNIRDEVTFAHFPFNLMTKYGPESGSIVISQLKSWD